MWKTEITDAVLPQRATAYLSYWDIGIKLHIYKCVYKPCQLSWVDYIIILVLIYWCISSGKYWGSSHSLGRTIRLEVDLPTVHTS